MRIISSRILLRTSIHKILLLPYTIVQKYHHTLFLYFLSQLYIQIGISNIACHYVYIIQRRNEERNFLTVSWNNTWIIERRWCLSHVSSCLKPCLSSEIRFYIKDCMVFDILKRNQARLFVSSETFLCAVADGNKYHTHFANFS